MCPEAARVFIIEDDESTRGLIELKLTQARHKVVLRAATFDDAVAMVGKIRESGVQVVTLDKNLTEGRVDGTEGELILKMIREKVPEVKIVGLADSSFPETDYDLGKDKLREVGKVVTEL